MISIVIGALKTVIKGLLQGLEDFEIRGGLEAIIEISQNTKKEAWRLKETCCHSDSSGRSSTNAGGKKLWNE